MVRTQSRCKEMTGFLSLHIKKPGPNEHLSGHLPLLFSCWLKEGKNKVNATEAPFLRESSLWLT